jgi:homoserine O-acetyltransferase/O-succinyltransferase
MNLISEPTFDGEFTFAVDEPFLLTGGANLQPVTLHYTTYGKLNRERDNAILVCHALSGSSRVADWWPELFGQDKPFDTSRHFIICSNVIGSCYGSTGPRSINPATNLPFKSSFPMVTIADMVKAQSYLLDHLGIEKLYAVVGGSIGGMQALQWAVDYPERVERCIAIAATPLSAMGLSLNHLQRQAIYNDPDWNDGQYSDDKQPVAGLALARAIAMCSYKSFELFTERFNRQPNRNGEDPYRSVHDRFDVAGYLDYQGINFTRRFDANSYVHISKAMDTFDPAYGYESEEQAFSRIQARMLLVGISSDWLFPAPDVRDLANRIGQAGVDVRYSELESSHGHDGFLADVTALIPLVNNAFSERQTLVVA